MTCSSAREVYERGEWVAAYEALSGLRGGDGDASALEGEDFVRLATAAYLTGRKNDCIQALQRAYQIKLDADDMPSGGEVCVLAGTGADGRWRISGRRRLGGPCAAPPRGRARRRRRARLRVDSGDVPATSSSGEFGAGARSAPTEIADYGRRFDDPNLVAMGLMSQGRIAALHRSGSRGTGTAGRGDGVHRDGHRVADLRGPSLLFNDRRPARRSRISAGRPSGRSH